MSDGEQRSSAVHQGTSRHARCLIHRGGKAGPVPATPWASIRGSYLEMCRSERKGRDRWSTEWTSPLPTARRLSCRLLNWAAWAQGTPATGTRAPWEIVPLLHSDSGSALAFLPFLQFAPQLHCQSVGTRWAGRFPSLHRGCVHEIESLKVIARTNWKYVLVFLCIPFPFVDGIFNNVYLHIIYM